MSDDLKSRLLNQQLQEHLHHGTNSLSLGMMALRAPAIFAAASTAAVISYLSPGDRITDSDSQEAFITILACLLLAAVLSACSVYFAYLGQYFFQESNHNQYYEEGYPELLANPEGVKFYRFGKKFTKYANFFAIASVFFTTYSMARFVVVLTRIAV